MGEISGIDCNDLADDTHTHAYMHVALHRGSFTYTHTNRHSHIK